MGWIQKFYVGLGFKNGPTYNSARNYGIYTYRNREWKCLISILALQTKTIRCSTDSERPHRRCNLPNSVHLIDPRALILTVLYTESVSTKLSISLEGGRTKNIIINKTNNK